MDPYFNIISVTDAYLNATLTKREEITGHGLFEVFPDNPDDPDATGVSNLRDSLNRVLANKVSDTMAVQKYDIQKPDGKFEERYWSPVNFPVTDEDGNVTCIIHRVEDVTEFIRLKESGSEQRQLTEELKTLTGQMEKEIILRSVELQETNKQLRVANEKAMSSVMLKEAFLANMSHEIRTPMNAIIGFTNILLTRDIGTEEREFVETIRSSGESLMRIINDILDVSKMEAKMMTFEVHPLSIKEIFKSLSAMLLPKATEKGLELRFDCTDDMPDILLGDPTRLTQILINLINNAIKFTNRGQVEVQAKPIRENGRQLDVYFSVADTGIGIAEDKLEDIFTRFQQADPHTTRNYGGTGLGLSIARQLVELQGGKMNIDSILDKGSVFSFTLAFERSTAQHAVLPENSLLTFDIATLGKMKILLVEDNPINVKLVVYLFSKHNIQSDTAGNGKIALEKIKASHYDLVLMDMEMPEMNGYDATFAIRNTLKNNVPIIAMTAHAMAGEKEKCLQLGMNDYISKPIDANALFEKMYRACFLKE